MDKQKSKTYWRRISMPSFMYQQPTDRGSVGNITYRELIRQINNLATNNLCHWFLPYYHMTIVPACFFIIFIWIFWLWKIKQSKETCICFSSIWKKPPFYNMAKPIFTVQRTAHYPHQGAGETRKYRVFAAKI